MYKIKNLLLPIFAFIILIVNSCSEKIAITEFKDDYDEYKSEPRIEAILNTTNLTESVVRIDRTILVTNTDIYDGKDNDGDWESYEDLNGNGKWDKGEPLNDDIGNDPDGEEGAREAEEGKGDGQPTEGEPHVDEIDEILPHVHDSSFNVALFEVESGKRVIDFKWSPNADDFQYVSNPETEAEEIVRYGGYIPDKIYIDEIDYSKDYEFEFSKKDTTITGQLNPLQPAVFHSEPNAQYNQDTLIVKRGKGSKIVWKTQREATVFWILVTRIYNADSTEIVEDMPMIPVSEDEEDNWIGKDFVDMHPPGLYKWEVLVPSRDYGHYFYSRLPIRDKKLNNLRDQNNNVVLGIAGSVAKSTQYVRIKNGEENK